MNIKKMKSEKFCSSEKQQSNKKEEKNKKVENMMIVKLETCDTMLCRYSSTISCTSF